VATNRAPRRFFHVSHRDLCGDPLGTVRSIYQYFGLLLSPETARQMQAWISNNPANKHGEHLYSVNEWGVTANQICEIFSTYRAEHNFS
jgi:hypothetical protein